MDRHVRDDNDVLAAFQFHNDWFQTDDNVAVRFTSSVSVVVLIIVACLKVFGELLRYLFVLH